MRRRHETRSERDAENQRPDCCTCAERSTCERYAENSFCTRWHRREVQKEGLDPNDAWKRGETRSI